jgi:phosphoribosyl 1,2-cyclic phosphodiesterase
LNRRDNVKLQCLASGSKGNCYLLENDTECLVLEAGIPFKKVKEALSFDILKIVGVVGSHLHKDHFGYAEEYLKCGIPVYASEETQKSLSRQYDNQVVVKLGYWYQIGGFNITPFECFHDVECYGFLIRHDDIGTLLFATDTAYIKNNFKKLAVNTIMVEANYSEEIVNEYLRLGVIDQARIDRTLRTHMEIGTTKEFIKANKTSSLDSVVLLHLSNGNSDEKLFKQQIQEVVGENVAVYVADKGLEIPLNICPF